MSVWLWVLVAFVALLLTPVALFAVLAAWCGWGDRRAAKRADDTTLNAAWDVPTEGQVVVADPADEFAAIAAMMPELADAPRWIQEFYLVPDEAWGGAR